MITDEYKEVAKLRLKPHVDKLIKYLKGQGIEVQLEDSRPNIENVILTKGDKEVRISHHCFYWYTGICRIMKQTGTKDGKPVYEYVKITDDMYMNEYLKAIILVNFADKKQTK